MPPAAFGPLAKLERRLLDTQEIAGSSPARTTACGAVTRKGCWAQLPVTRQCRPVQFRTPQVIIRYF